MTNETKVIIEILSRLKQAFKERHDYFAKLNGKNTARGNKDNALFDLAQMDCASYAIDELRRVAREYGIEEGKSLEFFSKMLSMPCYRQIRLGDPLPFADYERHKIEVGSTIYIRQYGDTVPIVVTEIWHTTYGGCFIKTKNGIIAASEIGKTAFLSPEEVNYDD